MKEFFEAIEAHEKTATALLVVLFLMVMMIADAIKQKNNAE